MKSSLLIMLTVCSSLLLVTFIISCSNNKSVEPNNDQTIVTFEKTFGRAGRYEGNSGIETSDGGFIVTGKTDSLGAGGFDVYLLKTDKSGNLLWEKTFGGTLSDIGSSVIETSDGGFIITGYTESIGAGGPDVYVIKTDNSGNLLWEKTFGGSSFEQGYSVIETFDDGYIITGITGSFGAGGSDVYLIKTDNIGNLVWEKSYGGSSSEYGYSVSETLDSGFIITGFTHSFGAGSRDVYLLKTDYIGNLLWEKTFGGSELDEGFSVIEASDGDFILTGYTFSSGAGSKDVYVIKTDNSGNIHWEKTFGGESLEGGFSVYETSNSSLIIIGYTESFGSPPYKDVYLIKTDSNGNLEWEKTFGGGSHDLGFSVCETSDGGIIITGTSYSSAFESYVYLIKTDSNGVVY